MHLQQHHILLFLVWCVLNRIIIRRAVHIVIEISKLVFIWCQVRNILAHIVHLLWWGIFWFRLVWWIIFLWIVVRLLIFQCQLLKSWSGVFIVEVFKCLGSLLMLEIINIRNLIRWYELPSLYRFIMNGIRRRRYIRKCKVNLMENLLMLVGIKRWWLDYLVNRDNVWVDAERS